MPEVILSNFLQPKSTPIEMEKLEVCEYPDEKMPSTARHALLSTQLLLALNVALMFSILVGGFTVYQDFSTKYAGVQHLVSRPEQMAPYVEAVMKEAATSFILGALKGSVAGFLGDLLRPEPFASTGTAVNAFAKSVMTTFNPNSLLSTCSDFITCPAQPNGYYPYALQCQNGRTVWCNYQGEQFNCANQTCVAPYVYSVASWTKAISGLLAQFSTAEQGSNSNAAFNTGLLNLEAILPWVSSQANASDWQRAGVRCLDFVQIVNGVDWTGEYADFNGAVHVFDVSTNVREVTQYVQQVCQYLVDLQ